MKELSRQDLAASYIGHDGAEALKEMKLLLVNNVTKGKEEIENLSVRILHDKFKFSQICAGHEGVIKKYADKEIERRAEKKQ